MAPRREQSRGRVVEVAQPTWILGGVTAERQDLRSPQPLALCVRVELLEVERDLLGALGRDRREQIGLRESQDAGCPTPRPVEQAGDARRQPAHEERPAQARVARGFLHAAHAAISPTPSRR